jgi:osmoprotectant transport system substrate-binding protein
MWGTKHWPSALLAVVVLATSTSLAACGDDGGGGADADVTTDTVRVAAEPIAFDRANRRKRIVMGSRTSSEQALLGEIFAQAIAAAGYDVRTELTLLEGKGALTSLEIHDVDAYPEYTGMALSVLFGIEASEIPDDPGEVYEEARKRFDEKNMTALRPTPFSGSSGVALTEQRADDLGVEKISDLEGKSEGLSLYGPPECRSRDDCLSGLQDVYELEFDNFISIVPELRHTVLTNGQAELSMVFATDPQIKRDGLVVLKDDRGLFPPYNATLVVRDDTMRRAGPDLRRAAEQAAEGLTQPVMRQLNAQVDIDDKAPQVVAREYLKDRGLIE